MSIFKATFPQGIQDQLTARQNKMLMRDNLNYLNSRTAWTRMTSAVNVNGSSDLAKNNILLGGALSAKNNSLKYGIGTTGTEAYSTKTSSGTNHRLGIRPMPGITNIEISNVGAYGSMRKVTINFQCWDIHQLEELELLYMRPGYSVLVEWGWVPYLDNNGNLKNNISFNDDVLNGGKTKEEIWKNIFSLASSNGNYDAIYGLIKNYGWSVRADGGYDCFTELITLGEIVESLKINYCDNKTNQSGIFGVITDMEYFKKGSDVNKSYNKSRLAGILNELWLIGTTKVTDSFSSALIELKSKKYTFYRYDISINKSGDESIVDSFAENDQQIYIKLKDFVEILNDHILLYDKKADKPVVTLSVQEGEHNGGTEGDLLLCLGNKLQLSVDPSVCLIKNMAWTDPKTNLGLDTSDTDIDTIKKLIETLPEEDNYFYEKDFSDKQLGIIGNIYVNLGYLYSLATDDELASQDKKEKKEISLRDYIKSILSGVNTSIGNVANLDLFVDPTDSVARIVDLNYVDTKKRIEAYENSFVLEMHNLQSTVRSYSLNSNILPEQLSIIAIGAQTKGGALGTDDNTLIDFNKGLEDRIIPAKEMPPPPDKTKANDDKAKLEAYKTNIDLILSYINKSDPDWWEFVGDFDVENASKYANALRDIINYRKAAIKDDNKNKSIIPTKLSIEMDGIGGIVVGNIFRIPDELLPKGYKGGSVGAKIAYVVTEIGGSVKDNDWITKITAQFIVLDDPSGGDDAMWNSAIGKIIKATVKQTPTKTPEDKTPKPPESPTKPNTPQKENAKGEGCVALEPNVSSIKDSDLDIIKGTFTSNTGPVQDLAVVDGHPVGKEVAKAIMVMKKAAAKDGISLRVNSGFRSPYTAISGKSTKGNSVSAQSQQSLYNAYLASSTDPKKRHPKTAKPGSSPHGYAIAFDLNTGSVTGDIKTSLQKPIYQWLIKNAYKFGFVRYVATEEWHWQYMPGTFQYNSRVPKSNSLYKGMDLEGDCETLPYVNSFNNTNSVDAIFIGGLEDLSYGGVKMTQNEQLKLFNQSYGANKLVTGFKHNASTSSILNFLSKNPKVPVVMFSAGCDKADEIAASPNSDKDKIYIIEPWAKNGNIHVSNAVRSGVPASHVYVGRDIYTGVGVVKGASSSNALNHFEALIKVAPLVK